jgi:hydrogenase maturation protein HypF
MPEPENNNKNACVLTIQGLVQGVGFRPYVVKLAKSLDLKGWVKNTNNSVSVHIQGNQADIDNFLKLIYELKPLASRIQNIIIENAQILGIHGFYIEKSEDNSNEITLVSPDIAMCNDCLADLKTNPHRIGYPLINCSYCGPRFTIIKALPYDRPNTSMCSFEMCSKCKMEYEDITDRRFHAQPIACNNCGPKYSLLTKEGLITDLASIFKFVSETLLKGGIFAFKGTGGFHLACGANNEKAVARLRDLKHRDTKPFAVMFKNIDTIKKYASVSEIEENELLSFRRPIVILKETGNILPLVNYRLGTIGAMLPYMPFHHLLFENLPLDSLVMTSGNFSDEPIVISNEKAIADFGKITDGVLGYNRDIYNRTDDSVVRVVNNSVRIIRRSRGYVPSPVQLSINTEGIFASGAEMTGTFCIGKGNQAILSQYFGDLQNFENFNFYSESFKRFKSLFRFEPYLAVADLHPNYVTNNFSHQLGIEVETVQHHHAHIASVIAENEIEGPVIGVAFDGTGYGTDGNIWGSEFLICEGTGFSRYAHFEYMSLPGGDKAVLEPWRSSVSYLYKTFGKGFLNFDIPFVHLLDKRNVNLLLEAIDKKINSPLSCSAGRLFDAVAAITGICNEPSFHAEAPMRLEAAIDNIYDGSYNFQYSSGKVSFGKMWSEIIPDLKKGVTKSEISTKFHNTIVNVVVLICKEIREKTGIDNVALSGGTFQNKYLLENIEDKLKNDMFKVFSNRLVPANDGGIALGQMYIAATKREKLCV